MNPNLMLLVLLTLTALVSACEPIIKMRGRVTEKMPAEATSPAEPVEGATVRLYCPEDGQWRAMYEPMTTDAEGRFADDKIGGPALECEFRAQSDAHKPASVSLEDACVKVHDGKYCFETQADIQMELADSAEPTG